MSSSGAILKFCRFDPNALVLRRREAASKDAPVRASPGAAFWSILRDARLRLAPQDEGMGSPRQSTFTVNRTNFESGTLAARRQRQEIILSIKRARPKANRLPERNTGRFGFAVTGEFTTTRLDVSGAAASSTICRSRSKGRR
jgi:hypothetical protein